MVTLDDLNEWQRAALAAIVAGGPDPRRALAWTAEEVLIDEGHRPDLIDELVGMGLVVRWALPTMASVTLTAYGAWLMGVKILERMTILGEELEEDPYWAELAREPAPLHLPKRRHEVRWPWMDEAEDPKAKGPEILEDEEGEPVLVMGRPVPIDKRLGKGKAKAKRRKAG